MCLCPVPSSLFQVHSLWSTGPDTKTPHTHGGRRAKALRRSPPLGVLPLSYMFYSHLLPRSPTGWPGFGANQHPQGMWARDVGAAQTPAATSVGAGAGAGRPRSRCRGSALRAGGLWPPNTHVVSTGWGLVTKSIGTEASCPRGDAMPRPQLGCGSGSRARSPALLLSRGSQPGCVKAWVWGACAVTCISFCFPPPVVGSALI